MDDRRVDVLFEAAFAKNVRRQSVPAVYLAAEAMPLAALWPECGTANELVGYARHKYDWELEKQAYRTVYPRIGTTALSAAGRAMPAGAVQQASFAEPVGSASAEPTAEE